MADSTAEVAVPDGATAKICEIGPRTLGILSWDPNTKHLRAFNLLHVGPEDSTKVFAKTARDGWRAIQEAPTPNMRIIRLEEDMNTPPRITAGDRRTGRHAVLLDLNPQFGNLRFARVDEITWKGLNGRETKGGLYYPVNYVEGQRYPLVIQTHGWNPRRFWIDGPFTTGFAAQALAAKDTMVLQADESYEDWDTPKEVDREVAAFESVIEHLDKRGLIDRSRVGITGFSRTCAFVKYALTHSKYHFAAASVTDVVDAGYFQYIAFFNTAPGFVTFYEGTNGGMPFGEGLKSWMDRSPGFNVDKVQTPLRIVGENPTVVLSEWEWFAALTRLGKPVEMVMMKDGAHILQRPWERMISQQGNVDWFDFWLNGHEDPDPAKKQQYARWRELRKLHHQNEKNSPAPSPN